MKYKNFWIGVISTKRPGNIEKMNEKINVEATWYVGNNEKNDYRSAKKVIESGGLCESRNRILLEAFKRGLTAVELSDDLKGLSLAIDKENKRNMDFTESLDLIYNRMVEHGAYYGGCAPTDNLFYFNPDKKISFTKFIVGDFILIRSCDIFFDENLKLKEDYDYTLQHLYKYEKVLRCNDILASFLHRSNKGGAVAVRTSDLEQESIKRLHDKWGEQIVLNPRRENEILMKYKPELAKQNSLF
jgi:hypothetical protein